MSNQFNFQFKERFPLTDRAIETIINSIKEDYGLVVREVKETENGYLFIGRYGFTIGDVTFDESIKKYRQFNYHEGVKDRIRDRDRAEAQKKKKKKFKLQKYKKIGITLTASAIIALCAIGAVKLATNVFDKPEQQIEVVQQMNTVANANDLILYSWANYAMNEVYAAAERSDVEYADTLCEELRNNNFNAVMMNYFNYTDQLDSVYSKIPFHKLYYLL